MKLVWDPAAPWDVQSYLLRHNGKVVAELIYCPSGWRWAVYGGPSGSNSSYCHAKADATTAAHAHLEGK